jgi:hypothetical protein
MTNFGPRTTQSKNRDNDSQEMLEEYHRASNLNKMLLVCNIFYLFGEYLVAYMQRVNASIDPSSEVNSNSPLNIQNTCKTVQNENYF